ncbi:ABC transporter substrate-binding protein [Amycolatopsis sp. NPDC051372]|uniref:ABC transporter substrate-binding protein n=1 Tax=unclassified Amycolatopsis TaxID=2618356 RepID=UPI00342BF22F
MRGTRITALATALLAGALAVSGCSGSSGSTSSSDGTIRVALNNTNDSLAVVVAQQQGFFTKHGIKDVKTTTLNDITLVPSLLNKQYDLGFSVAPIMLRASSSGVPLVAVSGNNGDSPEDQSVQIFVRPDITDVKQLQGKRIGSPTLTGNINIATKAWLSKNGVDPAAEQFVQVPTPNMIDELKAGQVDAVEVINPFITVGKQAGMRSLGDPERALSPNYLGGTYWIASKDWTSANPKLADGFKAALQDAAQWIKANNDKAYTALAAYTKVTAEQAKKSPLGEFTTEVSQDDLKIWGDAMKQFGGFGGTVDYSKLVYTGSK